MLQRNNSLAVNKTPPLMTKLMDSKLKADSSSRHDLTPALPEIGSFSWVVDAAERTGLILQPQKLRSQLNCRSLVVEAWLKEGVVVDVFV